MQEYEKLGAFYLGRPVDPASGQTLPEPLLYDAKDLTTHAVILGMTGSGKTGLGVGLLEEAAIDGIPVIAIDPKGDLGNLLLDLSRAPAAGFRALGRCGRSPAQGDTIAEHAAAKAALWRDGLASWDQEPARIARYAAAADRVIYTPGSRAGTPLAVLRSFAAPAPAVIADPDAMRQRVQGAVAGLCALLDLDPDPLRSRDHILLASILDHAWRAGRDLGLADLIRQIQAPPFEQVGVFDLESFYPQRDRQSLAMMLNNLLASPSFSVWAEGQPLDIDGLLRAPDGRPRVSVLSIAHLGDTERMFFVTTLLNELVSWMRAQPGTTSLRALLYMDEVFGYFRPAPSRRPRSRCSPCSSRRGPSASGWCWPPRTRSTSTTRPCPTPAPGSWGACRPSATRAGARRPRQGGRVRRGELRPRVDGARPGGLAGPTVPPEQRPRGRAGALRHALGAVVPGRTADAAADPAADGRAAGSPPGCRGRRQPVHGRGAAHGQAGHRRGVGGHRASARAGRGRRTVPGREHIGTGGGPPAVPPHALGRGVPALRQRAGGSRYLADGSSGGAGADLLDVALGRRPTRCRSTC